MATILQENLAAEIVNSKGKKNKKELLVSAGYDLTTAEASPGRTIQQKGVKKELAKYGLTDKLVTASLVDDIKKKPQKRLGELVLGADILGLKDNKKGDTTINVDKGVFVLPSEIITKYKLNEPTETI